MPVKRIASVSTKNRATFLTHTVSDDLIDWLKRKTEDGEDLPIRQFCHDGEGEKIPVVEGSDYTNLIAFECVPLTVDEIGWAEDQAVAHMNNDVDGNEGSRYENLKSFFAFRKSVQRVRNLFEVGDEFAGDTLTEVFIGLSPDIQREIGRVALRRSMIESSDKKKVLIARTMEAQGELDRLGFSCALCQSDKELHAYRGCGVAPDLDAGAGNLPVFDEQGRPLPKPAINLWDSRAFIDDHYKEHPTVPLDPLSASEVYMHAGQCFVHDFTGDLWPWCPAWFARFYQGPHAAFADHVITLAGLATRGLLTWAVREQPTGAEVAGVNIVLGLRERLKTEGEERAYREARQKE